VYDSCAQRYAHKYEQFLILCLVRASLVFVCFKGLICILVCFCVSSEHFGFVLLVNSVGFGFSVPCQEIGWEQRLTSPKWPITCWVERKTLLHPSLAMLDISCRLSMCQKYQAEGANRRRLAVLFSTYPLTNVGVEKDRSLTVVLGYGVQSLKDELRGVQ